MQTFLIAFVMSYFASIPLVLIALRCAYGDEFKEVSYEHRVMMMCIPILNQAIALFFIGTTVLGCLLALMYTIVDAVSGERRR